MSKTLENLKSGNYEVVDNQGVSVTQHFIECLEKEFANLEAKLAESEADKKALISDYESRITKHQELMSWLEHNKEELKQQLEELEASYNSTMRYLNATRSQLLSIPKKIVEEIKIEMGSIEDILINCGNGKEDALSWFNKILQTILKKYEANKNE